MLAQVYNDLQKLGAPTTLAPHEQNKKLKKGLTTIGYRCPFCFLGWKGAQPGQAISSADAIKVRRSERTEKKKKEKKEKKRKSELAN